MLYRIAEFVVVVKLVEDVELREPEPFLYSTDESRKTLDILGYQRCGKVLVVIKRRLACQFTFPPLVSTNTGYRSEIRRSTFQGSHP